MLRSPVLWRIYAIHVALIGVAMVLAHELCARWIDSAATQRTARELEGRAFLARDLGRELVTRGADLTLEGRLRELTGESDATIAVLLLDGTVVASSGANAEDLADLPRQAESLAAIEGGVPARDVRTAGGGARTMHCALPLRDGSGALVGLVHVSRPIEDVRAQLDAVRRALVLAGIAGSILSFVAALLFTHGLTRSLRSMTSVAESMASGDYHERVRSTAAGELGRLARAFDTMAEELERHVEAVTTDRNQVAAILAGMSEGVVAIDRDERILHMNQVAARLLRTARSPAQGLRIWEVTRLQGVREILSEAMAVNGPVKRELRFGTDGPALELHSGPLTDGRKDVVGAVLVLNDVTGLRRLEAVRRDFVANVSHELKTPLTAIRGLVETILDDPEMEPRVRQRFLERIEEQSHRLSALVIDLLTLSRLESHASRSEGEVVDFRGIVASSVERLRPSAEGKNIRLESALQSESMWVLGDEEELRQMVDNLIDNAVKYTPESGRVRVVLGWEEGEGAHRRFCLLEVIDTGIGIDPRHQDRIFERFYRVDKARSRELGGTGLGLSIVKHVAKDAGGRVSLESAPGLGSTFRVHLPLAG